MRPDPRCLVALASLAFVALGLPDGLLGVAWPSMRATFVLPLEALGPLLVASTTGYVVASFGGARLLARVGLGELLALSCAVTGASLLGYASLGVWPMVVALGLVAGLGAGGIDTGINTWAAARHGPRMLNWLHACYGIGAAGGPAIMTAVLADELPWQRGYALVGTAQVLLALVFVAARRAWSPGEVAAAAAHDGTGAATTGTPSIRASLRAPRVKAGMVLFFAYTGLELAIGAWTFTLLTAARGVAMELAGSSVSLYWIALTAGRVLGALLASFVSAAVLLRGASLALTIALALLAAGLSPRLDVAALLVAGAAAGPMFPMLIATTRARVGALHAGNAIGFQVAAAAVGQATIPWLLGIAGARLGLEALAVGLAVASLAVAAALAFAHARPRSTAASTRAPRLDAARASDR